MRALGEHLSESNQQAVKAASAGAGSSGAGVGMDEEDTADDAHRVASAAPFEVVGGVQATSVGGYMPMRPRVWQGSQPLGKQVMMQFPRHAARSTLAGVRWQALVQYLCELECVDADQVAGHCDGLSLLIQLYTPMPALPLNAVDTAQGERALRTARDGQRLGRR
jgi:hypothetical protein